MRSALRVVLLTGDQRRHRHAARRLSHSVRLAGVVSEAKFSVEQFIEGARSEDQRVVQRHFQERDRVEAELLGDPRERPGQAFLRIAHGRVNEASVFEWVRRRRPECLVLFGASIVRAPLLAEFSGRIVNLHLGLSPYYRGSGTNFWPLVHRQPECVGATLHLAVEKVDAGPILCQVRPAVRPSDGIHELGTGALLAALEILPNALERFASGQLGLCPQDLQHGKVYRRKDFDAKAVRLAWKNLETGMIPEYLAEKNDRDRRFPIVGLPDEPPMETRT